MSDGPKRIFLEPECCADPAVGRTWATDNPFECPEGCEATEYVRADLVEVKGMDNLNALIAAEHDRGEQGWRAARACAGLTLPADVPEGAVKDLVEAARDLFAGYFVGGSLHGEPDQWKQEFKSRTDDIAAALAALGVKP